MVDQSCSEISVLLLATVGNVCIHTDFSWKLSFKFASANKCRLPAFKIGVDKYVFTEHKGGYLLTDFSGSKWLSWSPDMCIWFVPSGRSYNWTSGLRLNAHMMPSTVHLPSVWRTSCGRLLTTTSRKLWCNPAHNSEFAFMFLISERNPQNVPRKWGCDCWPFRRSIKAN